MKKILLGVISLFLITSVGYAEDQPLQLTIKSDKQVYEAGDHIMVEMKIKNISTKDLRISYEPGWFFCRGWKVNGVDATLPLAALVKIVSRVIKAGKTFTQTIDLNFSQNSCLLFEPSPISSPDSKVVFSKEGKYEISFLNKLEIGTQNQEEKKDLSIKSNIITIEVVEKR